MSFTELTETQVSGYMIPGLVAVTGTLLNIDKIHSCLIVVITKKLTHVTLYVQIDIAKLN